MGVGGRGKLDVVDMMSVFFGVGGEGGWDGGRWGWVGVIEGGGGDRWMNRCMCTCVCVNKTYI